MVIAFRSTPTRSGPGPRVSISARNTSRSTKPPAGMRRRVWGRTKPVGSWRTRTNSPASFWNECPELGPPQRMQRSMSSRSVIIAETLPLPSEPNWPPTTTQTLTFTPPLRTRQAMRPIDYINFPGSVRLRRSAGQAVADRRYETRQGVNPRPGIRRSFQNGPANGRSGAVGLPQEKSCLRTYRGLTKGCRNPLDALRRRLPRSVIDLARRSNGRSTRLAVLQPSRSEEHTSELQSPCNLVCRLLLEKKKKKTKKQKKHAGQHHCPQAPS